METRPSAPDPGPIRIEPLVATPARAVPTPAPARDTMLIGSSPGPSITVSTPRSRSSWPRPSRVAVSAASPASSNKMATAAATFARGTRTTPAPHARASSVNVAIKRSRVGSHPFINTPVGYTMETTFGRWSGAAGAKASRVRGPTSRRPGRPDQELCSLRVRHGHRVDRLDAGRRVDRRDYG
jgi:hypothetical protein